MSPTPIEFLDGKHLSLTQRAVGPHGGWLAELHLFYLTFSELCRKCLCPDPAACNHPSNAELWKQFRQEQASGQPEKPAKDQIPAALLAWHRWAQQKQAAGVLDHHQVSVCYGPAKGVDAYDRIVYGSVEIVATVQEDTKHACDSVIMLRDGETYRAGRVNMFLTHTAPGCEPDLQHDTNIADVRLYAPVADTHQAAKRSSEAIGCPISKNTLVNAPVVAACQACHCQVQCCASQSCHGLA